MFLEISQNSQENTCVRVRQVLTFIKKDTLAQDFSRRFCEISKKTFITEHLQTTTPEVAVRRYAQPANLLKKRPQHRFFPVNFAKFLRTPFLTENLHWLLLCFFSTGRIKKMDYSVTNLYNSSVFEIQILIDRNGLMYPQHLERLTLMFF